MKTFPQSVKIVSYVSTATTREKFWYSNKPKTYNFRSFGKNFSERLLKTAFQLFTAQLWAFDQFLTKLLYLTILRNLGENLSDCGKLTRRHSQNCMRHVRKKLLVSHTFLKRMFLFVTDLGIWAKHYQHFDEIYRESPSSLFSKFSRRQSDARSIYWKKSFSIILLVGFRAKNFGKCCQNYLVDFRSHSLRNDIIPKQKTCFYS